MISERSFAKTFHAFWRELLPLLTPHFVSLFNEAYALELFDDSGAALLPLPVGDGVERMDLVAEYGFRFVQLSAPRFAGGEHHPVTSDLMTEAERAGLTLIQRYEGIKPEEVVPLSDVEKMEGNALAERYVHLFRHYTPADPVTFDPIIQGAGFLSSCQGDISVGSDLVEVKTTTRKVSGNDIRQVVIYAALDAASGQRRWTHFSIFNPRRGSLHRANIDNLIQKLSGGQAPLNVFDELITFVCSNDVLTERRF